MKKSVFTIRCCQTFWIAIVIWFITLLHDPVYSQQPDPLRDFFDTYVEKALADWNIPGLAIAVVKDDKVALAKGYGVRDIRKKGPVDANTLFAIASNTKAFTATALGLLVQEGKIAWDDPVIKYLPAFQLYDPGITRKITIRDLLCHRSGLATYGGDLTWYASNYGREEVIRRIRYQKPVFDFRTGFGYSNLMFLVAGRIIPAATGQSWEEFIDERFFKPLGMQRSNTSVKKLAGMENVATPHMIVDEKVVPIPYLNVDSSKPPGAINSCVNDLAVWLRLQLSYGFYNGKQLVDSAIIEETRTPHNLRRISSTQKKLNPSTHFITYGLGWGLSDYRGRLIVNHTGGLDGMFSYVGFMPEENLGVVVLTNREHHNLMRALAYHVYDAYLGVDFQDWSNRYRQLHQKRQQKIKQKKEKRIKMRIAGTKPTHSLRNYAGVYISKVYGNAKIEFDEGRLKLQLMAHPQIIGKMEHWQYNTFLCKWNSKIWDESFLYFDLNDLGEIAQFRIQIRPDWIDTLEYVFKKNE